MTTALILTLCIVSSVFGGLSELSLVLLTAAGLTLVYTSALVWDLRQINRVIRHVETSRVPSQAKALLTDIGNSVFCSIERLLRYYAIEQAAVQHESAAAILDPETECHEQLPSILDSSNTALNPGNYCESVAEYIKNSFPCSFCTLVIEKEGIEGVSILTSTGIDLGRYRTVLAQLARYIWHNTDRGELGLIAEDYRSHAYACFRSLGLTYSVRLSLDWMGLNRGQHGLLFVGFNASVPPNARLLIRLRRVRDIVQRELANTANLRKLSLDCIGGTANQHSKDILAQFSHDLRSPLNNIKSILSLLSLELTQPEITELVDAALGSCDNLTDIVEDVLIFSQHQAGYLSANKELCDLVECIEAAINNSALAARQKGLKLALHTLPHDNCRIFADRRHIKRIIDNLLSNAIKYTPRGRVDIRITTESSETLTCSIRDTGTGMNSKQLQHLFDPFTRFNPKAAEGIGIGLTVTRMLTELNGGQISVKSTPHHGSEFTLSFPAAAPVSDKQETFEPKQALNRSKKARIVVVDDNPDCVNSLASALKHYGHYSMRCYSISDAISVCNFGQVDVIIIDDDMPEGGGRHLLNQLKKRSLIPAVVVLSGGEVEKLRERYQHLEVRDFHSKPVEMEKLIRQIDRILNDPAKERTVAA